MERKPQDITLYAKLGFLIYANGYTAKIAGQKEATDQNGENVWEFTLDPSDELIKRYHLKPNPDPAKGMLYTVQIPCDLVMQLNPDPAWNRWFYLRTYDHQTTRATKKLEGTSQQEEIVLLKRNLLKARLKEEISKEKLLLMESNMPKYIKRNFMPLIEQMTPLINKMSDKKND